MRKRQFLVLIMVLVFIISLVSCAKKVETSVSISEEKNTQVAETKIETSEVKPNEVQPSKFEPKVIVIYIGVKENYPRWSVVDPKDLSLTNGGAVTMLNGIKIFTSNYHSFEVDTQENYDYILNKFNLLPESKI